MIKLHRPNFLIAQPDTPPAQRTFLQKIFHKKKDDLSLEERRAVQKDADRGNRKKLFGGLVTIERKKPDLQNKPDLQFLTTATVEHLRALAGRMLELDAQQQENEVLVDQNPERTQVANEIVNVFSAAARDGIDLSQALNNDEITYLTRAMGSAKKPELLRVEHNDQPVEVEVDGKKETIREATYTGSFDPLKNIARQTAALLHSSQVDRLLERMNSSASTLDESTRNLETQSPVSAGTLLENVEIVLSTLTHLDSAEVTRLCNQQGDLAESRILDSLINLEIGTKRLHDGTLKALDSPESGSVQEKDKRQLNQSTRLLEQIQASVVALRNEIAQSKLLARMNGSVNTLNESIRNLETQSPASARTLLANVKKVLNTLTHLDPAEVSRLCNQQGNLAESPILDSLIDLEMGTRRLHDGTLKALDAPQSGSRKKDKRQLKQAAHLLEQIQASVVALRNENTPAVEVSPSRTDSDDLFEIPTAALRASSSRTDSSDLFDISIAALQAEFAPEGEMQTRNASATSQDSPHRQAPSTSTSKVRLTDYLNTSLPPKTPDSGNDVIHSSEETDAARLPDGLGWPLSLRAFGGVIPSANTHPTRPNPRASEAAQLIEEMSAENPAYTGMESEAPGNWLEATGISIAANSGHGNDCLILSLLQHATGNYADNGRSVEREAEELRQELIRAGFAEEFENNQMLPVDSNGFRELVNRVNERYPQANMDVRIAVTDASGRPYFLDTISASNAERTLPIAARPNPGGNPVAILHQGHHYEALYSEHAEAQEENLLSQAEDRQWVDQALAHLKGLSSDLKSRLFKKAYSTQYAYAKSLSSEQRSQLEEVLESQFRGDAGATADKKEEEAAVNAWLSIQQARLRTHTQEERTILQNSRRELAMRSCVNSIATIVAPPMGAGMAFANISEHRDRYRAHYNSPSRPEYSAAFNNFIRILDDVHVSENLKEIIKERLTYHWKKEKTIAPYEASLLQSHGIDKLVESNYRHTPTDTNVGRDLARQTLTLGERMNVCLEKAKRPPLKNPQRFDLEQYADTFSMLLQRLSETTDASYRRTQAGLYEKAADVIEAIQDDAELRRKVFEKAKDGLGTCQDNVADTFGSVVNEVSIHQLVKDIDAGKIGKHNLLSSIKPQFRLKTLEEYVDTLIESTIDKILPEREKIESQLKKQLPPNTKTKLNSQLNELEENLEKLNQDLKNLSEESIETKLLFKTRLKKTLDLPSSVPEKMTFNNYSPFQKKDLDAARDHVLDVEKEGTALRSFLKDFSAWETGLKKLHSEKFSKVEEDFAAEEEALYDLDIPDAEKDPEGAADYAEKVVNLGQRKNQAILKVMEELTEEQFRRDSE